MRSAPARGQGRASRAARGGARPRGAAQETPKAPSFSRFAQWLSIWAGRPPTFAVACALLVAWAVSGPFFHFNDTWQLVINTSTTIVTFLMVFLIQNTQNRDTDALHIKIDELLRTTRAAHDALMGLDELDAEQLQKLRDTYQRMGEDAGAGETPQCVADEEQAEGDEPPPR
ncbi:MULTISPECIES: low affinity iron permease family protein [Pseudomonas]|uniref:low affinity iron permease family protein n=1 Tax=Pseudomonas TaxID=286 RepID=UPI002E26A627|nr:low affinity iron permease family protein [Pseudomonas sp. JH-2]